MPTDKEILFSVISREVDNLTSLNPILAVFNGTIKNKLFAFLEPYVDFFTEGETFQADMATSFAKREVQKKLEDFKQEFEAARRSDHYEG